METKEEDEMGFSQRDDTCRAPSVHSTQSRAGLRHGSFPPTWGDMCLAHSSQPPCALWQFKDLGDNDCEVQEHFLPQAAAAAAVSG